MKTFTLCLAAVLSILLTSIPAYSYAGPMRQSSQASLAITDTAVRNLTLLRQIVQELHPNMHRDHLNALGSIMMVESRGNEGLVGLPHAKPARRSYGLMQLTIPTARVLFRDNADLREEYFGDRSLRSVKDEEVKRLLLRDNRLNIVLGIALYRLYMDMIDTAWVAHANRTGNLQLHMWERVIAAYNMGIGNALKRPNAPFVKYVQDVKKWMPVMAALNQKLDAQNIQVETPSTTKENILGIKGQPGEQNGQKEDGTAVQGTMCNESSEQCRRSQEVQNDSVDNHALLSTGG